ncbi:hypothetical protein C4D60_Mb10t28690 [Musa balbisiana]|uniref:Uncharacterized protein n=1 Tax=Musa balbisiana TaxID=52838 RepID=A0A4S8J2Z0_MUSBA|nr:hypothetical protein C4D60_Mb10t28690 [Musa balbisiana]
MASPQLVALGRLEFRKAFLILSYIGRFCGGEGGCPVVASLCATVEDSRLRVSLTPALKSNSASLSMLKHPPVTAASWRRRMPKRQNNDDEKDRVKAMARSLISLLTYLLMAATIRRTGQRWRCMLRYAKSQICKPTDAHNFFHSMML